MIHARSVYRHRHTGEYVLTDYASYHPIFSQFITVRMLTRDLNVPGGFIVEQHSPTARLPARRFENDWEFIKEFK